MKNHIFLFLALFTFSHFLGSCSEKDDSTPDPNTDQSVNEWIYGIMEKDYLWNLEIPSKSSRNFNDTPDVFFNSLLSESDLYSRIEEKSNTTKSYHGDGLTLGFEYIFYYIQNKREYALKVLYILPNSPASNIDLHRGDWIYQINNQPVSEELVRNLNSGSQISLGIADAFNTAVTREVTLQAQNIIDHPIMIDTTYYINNQKIGYLLYNHFTSDPNNNGYSSQFDTDLCKAFAGFKREGISDLILDLRYNGGGLISSAQVMASMLVPQTNLGDVFCKLTYNQDRQSENTSLPFLTSLATYNLDLKRLYVITGGRTASASETVINGLKPFYNVTLIGEKTVGKNVGSNTYSDSKYTWELHPLICYVTNKEEYDYSAGFTPDIALAEPDSYLKDLGDTNEELLSRVISLITGSPRLYHTEQTNNPSLVPIYNSLDRRKMELILP